MEELGVGRLRWKRKEPKQKQKSVNVVVEKD